MTRVPYETAIKQPEDACACGLPDRDCYERGHWNATPRTWMNPISGLVYVWDAEADVWRSTGDYPLDPNPMGLLGETP
jgi:hypothetical protein